MPPNKKVSYTDYKKYFHILFNKPKQLGAELSEEVHSKVIARNIKTLTRHNVSEEKLKEFMNLYCPKENYIALFGEGYEESLVVKTETIRDKYSKENETYGYFNEGEAVEKFEKLFRFYKFLQLHEEGLNDDMLCEAAYKSLVFFDGDINVLQSFVEQNMPENHSPIHDMSTKAIPKCEVFGKIKFDLKAWQHLIKTTIDGSAIKALDLFQNAERIHSYLMQNGEEFCTTVRKLRELSCKLSYKQEDANPLMARNFAKYNISEERFDQALKFYNEHITKAEKGDLSLLPNVIVKCDKDGTAIPLEDDTSKEAKYYALKLPKHHPLVLILGDVTGSCQSFDSNGANCVKDGILYPENGFYVFLQSRVNFDSPNINWGNIAFDAKIFAQCYAWRSSLGNLTFDSIEISMGYAKITPIKTLLSSLAAAALKADPTISRVTLGSGGGTKAVADQMQDMESKLSEIMLKGRSYGDANNQYEIAVSEELKTAREEAAKIVGKEVKLACPRHLELVETSGIDSFDDYTNLELRLFYAEFVGQPLSAHLSIPDTELSNRIKALYDTPAQNCYEQGFLNLDAIKSWDSERIQSLTSHNAQKCYKAGITFEKLSALETEQIRVLTTCPPLYQLKIVNFEDAVTWHLEKAQSLLAYDGIFSIINLGNRIKAIIDFASNDLTEVKLPKDFILCGEYEISKVLESFRRAKNTKEELEGKFITFKEIEVAYESWDTAKFKAIFSNDVADFNYSYPMSLGEISSRYDNFGPEKFKALTRGIIGSGYASKAFSMEEVERLYDTNEEKFSNLFKDVMNNAYTRGVMTLKDIERIYDSSPERLKLVINNTDWWNVRTIPKEKLIAYFVSDEYDSTILGWDYDEDVVKAIFFSPQEDQDLQNTTPEILGVTSD